MSMRFFLPSIVLTLLVPGIVLGQTATDVVCIGCVGNTDLANAVVTVLKLGNNAVTTAKINNGTILNADISTSAAIDPLKILGAAWTAANDGAASGLDADVLDGLDSVVFLRNDQSGTLAGMLSVVTAATETADNAELRIQSNNPTNDRSAVLRFMPSGIGGSLASGGNKAILRLEGTSTASTPWGFDFQNTSGSSIFGITNDGNVGIGVTNPSTQLDVRLPGDGVTGTYFLTGGSQVYKMLGVSENTADNGLIFDNTYGGAAYMAFRTHNGTSLAERFRIHTNGSIGIGTSSFPNSGAPEVNIKAQDGSNAAGLGLQSFDDTSSLYLRSGTGGSDGSLIAFQNQLNIGETTGTGTTGFSTKVTIESNGYVGIGTSPAKPLTVNAGTNDPLYLLSDSNHSWYVGPNVGGQRFGIYDQTDASMKMYVDSNGDMCFGACD